MAKENSANYPKKKKMIRTGGYWLNIRNDNQIEINSGFHVRNYLLEVSNFFLSSSALLLQGWGSKQLIKMNLPFFFFFLSLFASGFSLGHKS